jgi:hypothetical protein
MPGKSTITCYDTKLVLHIPVLIVLDLIVPRDCVASNTEEENAYALDQMKKILKANTRPSAEISLKLELQSPEARFRSSPRVMQAVISRKDAHGRPMPRRAAGTQGHAGRGLPQAPEDELSGRADPVRRLGR